MASHNPTDMFSSSYRLSWWNICSVVNGFIVAFRSGGQIVKFIDLFFEWHNSSFSFDSCNSTVWVWVCVSTVSGVYKSGPHQWVLSLLSVLDFFFFLNRTIDLCFRTEVSQVFVSHPLWGCGSQSRSNNDPHKSLHEPLTAENKTLLLTWKEMRRKKSTFVVGGLSPYQTWKTTMISHVDKSQAQISTWIPHSCNGKHLCKSKLDDKQYSRINKKAQLCWRKAQR